MHRLSAYVIVHRTQSNQTPNAIQSDGGRKPIGWRTETPGVQLSPLGFAACQSKNCTNKANRTTKVNDTNVGGYGILAVVTLPSAVIFSHR